MTGIELALKSTLNMMLRHHPLMNISILNKKLHVKQISIEQGMSQEPLDYSEKKVVVLTFMLCFGQINMLLSKVKVLC